MVRNVAYPRSLDPMIDLENCPRDVQVHLRGALRHHAGPCLLYEHDNRIEKVSACRGSLPVHMLRFSHNHNMTIAELVSYHWIADTSGRTRAPLLAPLSYSCGESLSPGRGRLYTHGTMVCLYDDLAGAR